MYFLAEANDKKYEINVQENKAGWVVSIKGDSEDWRHYNFSREDYQYHDDTISFLFKDSSYLLDVTRKGVDYTVYTRGAFRTVKVFNEEALLHESLKGAKAMGSSDSLISEMPGKIVKIFVKAGDIVNAGDPLLVMEAMKMENEMRAAANVKIKSINVSETQNVESGTLLISFEKVT